VGSIKSLSNNSLESVAGLTAGGSFGHLSLVLAGRGVAGREFVCCGTCI